MVIRDNASDNSYFSSFLFVASFVMIVTLSLTYTTIITSNIDVVSIVGAYAKRSSDKLQSVSSNIESTGTNTTAESSQPNIEWPRF